MKSGIEAFISEEALEKHREYLRCLRLKYSVIEKSFPKIKNESLYHLARCRDLKCKEEILSLRCEILCHELFFDSFGAPYQSSSFVRDRYGSEAAFIYELFEKGKTKAEFLVIHNDRGRVDAKLIFEPEEILSIKMPRLAIDLCEHSYFLDYGFDKESYLSNLLPFIKLGALDKFLSNKD